MLDLHPFFEDGVHDPNALVEHPQLEKNASEQLVLEELSGDQALVDVDGLFPVMQEDVQQVAQFLDPGPVGRILMSREASHADKNSIDEVAARELPQFGRNLTEQAVVISEYLREELLGPGVVEDILHEAPQELVADDLVLAVIDAHLPKDFVDAADELRALLAELLAHPQPNLADVLAEVADGRPELLLDLLIQLRPCQFIQLAYDILVELGDLCDAASAEDELAIGEELVDKHQLRLNREDKPDGLFFLSPQLHQIEQVLVLKLSEGEQGIVEDGFCFDALTGAQVHPTLEVPEDEVGASPDLALIPVEGLEVKATVEGGLLLEANDLFVVVLLSVGEILLRA